MAENVPLSGRAAAALVFLTSGGVLVLELVSLRLIAPYIGLTLETNTAVIGIALTAIAAGAWLGGRSADVAPPQRLLGPLILGSGALVMFVGPAVRWTGSLVRDADLGVVLLMAAIAVFVPAALMSAIPPMVVKLRLATLAQTGSVVGRLSSIGTLGAIVATFGTGFILVAAVPTHYILLGLGSLLVVVGAIVTIRLRGWKKAVPYVAAALVGSLATTLAPRPCDIETAYHCAKIEADPARPTGRTLRLDTLSHSYVDLKDPTFLEFAYIRGIASLLDVYWPAGQRVDALHLGGGGVTVPRYLDATRPGTDSLVYEIDKGVVDLDVEQLGLRTGDGIDVRVRDARIGLAEQAPRSRDVVVGDAFGGVSVPWHLTTKEVVQSIHRILRPGGVYAVNVIDYPPLGFARAEIATIASVFENVAIIAKPGTLARSDGGNLVLVASDEPLPIANLQARLAERDKSLSLLSGKDRVAEFTEGARILTDAYAPVDQLLAP